MNAFLYMVILVVVAVCAHSLGIDEGFDQCASIKDREIDRAWDEIRKLRKAIERRFGGSA